MQKKEDMITDTMTYYELSKELWKLNSTLSLRGEGWKKKYHKEIKKKGIQCLSCQKLDTNLYFILVVNNTEHVQGFGYVFLVLRSNKWIAIVQSVVESRFNIDTEIYESHFFSRYNERFNIGKTGINLMFQYFKENINEFKVIREQEHNGKTYLLSDIKNGMSICEVVNVGSKRICFYKTCVSKNLLSEKQLELKEQIMKELDLLNKM